MQKAHAAEQRPRRSAAAAPSSTPKTENIPEEKPIDLDEMRNNAAEFWKFAAPPPETKTEIITITMARKDWFIIRDIVLALKSLANVFFEPIHTHDAGYILDPLVSQLLEIFNSWEGAPE